MALAHLAHAELDQVFGFEPASGPSIPLLKLDSKEVVCFLEFAVFDASLTSFAFEMKRQDSVGRDRLLEFEARTGRRDILQDRPLAPGGPEVRLPLHSYKVCAKLSVIFSSVDSHD